MYLQSGGSNHPSTTPTRGHQLLAGCNPATNGTSSGGGQCDSSLLESMSLPASVNFKNESSNSVVADGGVGHMPILGNQVCVCICIIVFMC